MMGVPAWLSQLSVQLLISGQILISRSLVQAPHWAPRWARNLLKIFKKKEKKERKEGRNTKATQH